MVDYAAYAFTISNNASAIDVVRGLLSPHLPMLSVGGFNREADAVTGKNKIINVTFGGGALLIQEHEPHSVSCSCGRQIRQVIIQQ